MHLIIVGAVPICAIVIPLDDERLRDKFSSESSALILQKHERVRLWRGYVPADDFWVYDGSELAFCKFRRQLIERVIQDDFELKFSLLALIICKTCQNFCLGPGTAWRFSSAI